MNNGGDVLARGAGSAQFSAGGSNLTYFEADFVYKDVAEVLEKYGLTQEEYDVYHAARDKGEKLPDLRPLEEQALEVNFAVNDHRTNYLSASKEVKLLESTKTRKFADSTYDSPQTLLDRILVMVISDDPNIEILEDGSARDKRNGFITSSKYRQHSNVGIVLLAGQWVVTGGVKTPMSDVLKPGDKVIYGDYGSEKLPMDDNKAEALCDALSVNYEKTEQGLRVVRVQDVRIVYRRSVVPLGVDQEVVNE